jgi:hypothetical protein
MTKFASQSPELPEQGEDFSWIPHLAFAAVLLTCITGWVLLVFMAQQYLAPYYEAAVNLPPLSALTLRLSFFASGVVGMACFAGLLAATVLAWRMALKGRVVATIFLILMTVSAAVADAAFIYAFGQPQRNAEDQILTPPAP